MTPIVAVAWHCSIPQQQPSVAFGYVTLLHSRYGTVLSLEFLRDSAVAELLREGGFYPPVCSTVAVPFLRGPHCYSSGSAKGRMVRADDVPRGGTCRCPECQTRLKQDCQEGQGT